MNLLLLLSALLSALTGVAGGGRCAQPAQVVAAGVATAVAAQVSDRQAPSRPADPLPSLDRVARPMAWATASPMAVSSLIAFGRRRE